MNTQKTFLDQFIDCHMNILENMLNDIQNKYKINDSEFVSKYMINKDSDAKCAISCNATTNRTSKSGR